MDKNETKKIRWWNKPFRISVWSAILISFLFLFNQLSINSRINGEDIFSLSLGLIFIWGLYFWFNKSADKWEARHGKEKRTA